MAARRVACDSLCLLLVGPTWRRLPECTAVSSSLGLAPSSENPRLGPELCVWACRKSSDFLSISEGLRVWGWWWRRAQGGVGSPRLFHGLSPGRQTPRHSVTGGHHSFPPKAPGEPSWVHSGCSRRVWAMAPGMAAPEAGLLLGWLSPSPWGSPHLCPSHPSFWAAEVTGGSVLDLCTQPGSLFSQGSSWTPAPAFLGARVASQIKASHSWSGADRGCHSPSSELLLPVGAVPGCPQSQPGRVSPFSCHFCYAGFGCVMLSLLASPGLAVSGSSPPKPGAGCLWVPQASVQVFSSLPDLLQTWQSLHVSVNIHISPWQVTRTSPRGSKKTIQSF